MSPRIEDGADLHLPPRSRDSAPPRLSVVIPLFDEEESVPPLLESLEAALEQEGDWEIVFVDDGSGDRTAEIVGERAWEDPRIKLISLARNFGQTAAMQAGFDGSRGRVVVTMDGDLQNDPRDIPLLVAKLDEGYDLVAGYRVRRQDRLVTRKVPSWVANRFIRLLTGVDIRDNGCSLKAFRRDLLDRVHLYSDMHRFIPAVAAGTAGARIAEVPVRHHARQYGRSKYGMGRIFKVSADLLTITMIRSFRERPLALFAMLGAGAGFLGLVALVLSFIGPTTGFGPTEGGVVFPGTSILLLGLAVYLVMLGVVAEVVLRALYRNAGLTCPLPRSSS